MEAEEEVKLTTDESLLWSETDSSYSITAFDASLLVLLRDAGGYGLSPYEVEQRIKKGDAGVLGRTASAVYVRLPALKKKGLLESNAVVGRRGRNANRYMLTPDGRAALEAWIRSTPVKLPRLDASELFIRIRASRTIEAKAIWHVFEPLFFELDAKREALDGLERDARRAGEWDFSKSLEVRLMRYQLDAYRMWLDEFCKEVGMSDPLTAKPISPLVTRVEVGEWGERYLTKTRNP